MKSVFFAVLIDLVHFVRDFFRPKNVPSKKTHSLHPSFETRTQYYAANPETMKLRLQISSYPQDKLQKPLSAEEFILYKLKDLRFSVGDETVFASQGFLHEKLKGRAYIHTSIRPSRHAVMEVFDSEQQPKLLFVDNVFGDESLEVESVGLYTIGEFRYDVFTKKEWQEWRPVFINFNNTPV